MYLALGLSLLLTFSYKIVEVIIRMISTTSLARFSIYLWAILIVTLIPIFNGNYVYVSPNNIMSTIPVFIVIIFVNFIISRFSGYHPIGKFNTINFIIVFPIIEEVIFRGLLLPYLNQYFHSAVLLQVMYMPVTFPVIGSALLFAICHLQYYKLSRQSALFLLFAFIGGITYGSITDLIHSIILAVLLHIEFNFFAVHFANKTLRDRS